jgi:hypothetical protein
MRCQENNVSDLTTEKLISLEEARQLPWLSKAYTFQTVWSWATDGSKARDGSVVLLETTREGRRLVTSEPAMRRYFERLSAERATERTPNEAGKAHARAAAALTSMGFKPPKPAQV